MSTPLRSSPLALTVLSLLHLRPLHPYGIQRLLKQWGKDQVVNVGQRTSLYRTIERLLGAGLIAVRETGRDARYPERTVYELTDAGRETTRTWLLEMLALPRAEYPEFPAALATAMLLDPAELEETLARRARALTEKLSALEGELAGAGEYGLPRITLLETEYLRAVTEAEVRWLESVREDLRAGRLAWSAEALRAFAEEQQREEQSEE